MNTNALSLSRSGRLLAFLTLSLSFTIGGSRFATAQEPNVSGQGPAATLVPLPTNAQGLMQLKVHGPSPRVYVLEASTDLAHWVRLSTNVMTSDSLVFTDPQPVNATRRFYRAIITSDAPYVPGQLLVQFRAATGFAVQGDILRKYGLQLQESLQTTVMAQDGAAPILLASVASDVHEVIAGLTQEPEVEFAEPDYIYELQATSNDPSYLNGSLWGMYGDATSPANASGSQAAEAWAAGHTGSHQALIGVIDTGVQFNHPDLAGNIWTNPFDPINGIDDDGNGFVDDIHGWDFFGDNNSVFDGSPGDPGMDSHGTHVSGTIGAMGGNGVGVVGVNWQVSIISAKIFHGQSFAGASQVLRAVDYFTDLKRRHNLNIVALNNSWGGRGYSRGLHEAIIRSANAGILFICAAGNLLPWDTELDNDRLANYPSNYDTTQGTASVSPAAYDSVIAVAAIDPNGGLAGFSHFGARSVDLGAPGVGVLSTVPWLTYASYSGTSMATPHVTGAAALLASVLPSASAQQIRQALLGSALPTSSLVGRTVVGGRLNVSGGIARMVPTCPGATVYVDLANVGTADGTAARPFQRVALALQTLAACPSVSSLSVRAGVYAERNLRFDRPVLLVASGGAALIGTP